MVLVTGEHESQAACARTSAFNQQGMLAGARFVFCGNANGAFAAHRAFMLANAATDAQFRIDVWLL